MGRSIKKGPYIDPNLAAKVADTEDKRTPIKTWARRSTIPPDFIGRTFMVHQGKQFVRVFVTEDSMTMLTEAIYSHRPVFSIRPERVAATGRYTRMLEGFAERGYLCRYAIAELVLHPQSLAGEQCKVLETSPLDDLAERLGRRLDLLEPSEGQS